MSGGASTAAGKDIKVDSLAAATKATTNKATTTKKTTTKKKTTTSKPKKTTTKKKTTTTTKKSSDEVYYKNCSVAREAGAAPLYKGDPGYRKKLDRDDDGVACE
ncbi:excalibur calcium-binding domain-containing protein [Paenibacillus sp. A14]